MNSGILKQRLKPDDQEAIYAELRDRHLRRADWKRVRRLSTALLAIAGLVAAMTYLREFGLSLPPGLWP